MVSSFSPASRAPRLDLALPTPPARILSNGTYRLLITPAGSGGSVSGKLSLTAWNRDPVEDPHGLFLFIRDLDTGACWPVGCRSPHSTTEHCEARWRPGVFEILRAQDGIEARLGICVAPDRNAELRCLRLVNRSGRTRRLEVTSFAEIVLADAASYRAHPAFSKLFVQTEYDVAGRAILARRRPRAPNEKYPWLVHALPGADVAGFETDRNLFIGRGTPPGEPHALASTAPLAGSTGAVLDPVASLRTVAALDDGQSVVITFMLGVADDRDGALALAGRYSDPETALETFAAAERAEVSRLAATGLTSTEGEYWQAIAGAMAYGHPGLRADRTGGRPVGDRQGVLRRYGMAETDLFAIVQCGSSPRSVSGDVIRARDYWRALGLPIEVLVLTDAGAGLSVETAARECPGCRVVNLRDVSAEDVDVLLATARLMVSDSLPDLNAELGGGTDGDAKSAGSPAVQSIMPASSPPGSSVSADLHHFNGYGGFTADGTEYVILIPRRADGTRDLPPLPWTNVIANEAFGCLVSETGAGMTWSGNSREQRLTPWSNDPVLDPHSEAFYLRDEESGDVWSPMPGPAPGPGGYETRHGFGASTFRTAAYDIDSECVVFVPRHERVRVTTVRLSNRGSRARSLSACSYYRLVLGGDPDPDSRHVVTEADAGSGTVFARSDPVGTFGSGVVFAATVGGLGGSLRFTTDRLAFLGHRGTAARPAALFDAARWNGRVGGAFDPCIAQQFRVDLAPGQTLEIHFLLGEADSRDEARLLAGRLSADGTVAEALAEVRAFWSGLMAVRIETPCPELDVLVNGWLPYQVVACRIWGRSAFYQSGGAFGFRDQLQDSSALLYAWPERTREQILLHAGHQFVEGDVLHWWHPPDSRGIRTRFTDDLLWLPWLTALYTRTTGDAAILEEAVPFLTARALQPGEDEAFLWPEPSGESADLYEHCCRALDRSLTAGAHGLPLFGTGDWNDGMNRVGREGHGESVWMGMFLHDVLGDFAPLCEARDDHDRLSRYRRYRDSVRAAINDTGWDGDWYRRGYYDNGEALGSRDSDECRIDALAQAWSVLSGAAPPDRAVQAMDAVEKHLISETDGIIRLLTPAFDRTPNDPGYIKGYVPGVRENGGQYTHAALWVVRAMAELGRNDRVAALLELLNPVQHAATRERADIYRVEPYVVAADIYGEPPHIGRGGWTWYTGAAGWMYRIALESLLGLHITEGSRLEIRPCIPDEWPEFRITYRIPGGDTCYDIRVTNPHRSAGAALAARLDGEVVTIDGGRVQVSLASDGRTHTLDVELGPGLNRTAGPRTD